ncbi:MAG: diaminopimelate decarboxylase [Planctomycetota bacterium]|nr:MAG: diaminopimelate decarboxylase [Planctomycetota bacterium]
MDDFAYREGILHAEGVSLVDLARAHGTPLYVYSLAGLRRRLRALRDAFGEPPPRIAYSVKANPHLAVVRAFAREGAGADVVSGGELLRARAAGVPAADIVFAGVGKREDELELGLDEGIGCFNVEVAGELELLDRLARARGVRAPVALRVNPDVAGGGHEYIQTGKRVNKFGIPLGDAPPLFRRAAALPGIELLGLACHVGSQILDLGPFERALARIADLARGLRAEGLPVAHVDVGGGLGVRYTDEEPPPFSAYAAAVRRHLDPLKATVVLEPGRCLTAGAGLLLTRVLYTKRSGGKRFVIVDAAMNDFARPALYGARHAVRSVREGAARARADVVGPVCETGDFLARDAEVPDAAPGDLLALLGAGAYGRSMASNYNSRPRAAEVLVHGGQAYLVSAREDPRTLFAHERVPEFLGAPETRP